MEDFDGIFDKKESQKDVSPVCISTVDAVGF